MGASPSSLTDEQSAELQERFDEIIERAANAIATADVLLVATGAGWSVRSYRRSSLKLGRALKEPSTARFAFFAGRQWPRGLP